jgi:hypothetical protein
MTNIPSLAGEKIASTSILSRFAPAPTPLSAVRAVEMDGIRLRLDGWDWDDDGGGGEDKDDKDDGGGGEDGWGGCVCVWMWWWCEEKEEEEEEETSGGRIGVVPVVGVSEGVRAPLSRCAWAWACVWGRLSLSLYGRAPGVSGCVGLRFRSGAGSVRTLWVRFGLVRFSWTRGVVEGKQGGRRREMSERKIIGHTRTRRGIA